MSTIELVGVRNSGTNRRKEKRIWGRAYLPQVPQVANINSADRSKDFIS